MSKYYLLSFDVTLAPNNIAEVALYFEIVITLKVIPLVQALLAVLPLVCHTFVRFTTAFAKCTASSQVKYTNVGRWVIRGRTRRRFVQFRRVLVIRIYSCSIKVNVIIVWNSSQNSCKYLLELFFYHCVLKMNCLNLYASRSATCTDLYSVQRSGC